MSVIPAEAGGLLKVQGQPGLHNGFKSSLDYTIVEYMFNYVKVSFTCLTI